MNPHTLRMKTNKSIMEATSAKQDYRLELKSSYTSTGIVEKPSLIRCNSLECQTEESSDDDISYGSDRSSTDGLDEETRNSFDYEPLFSDEEDFSEDDEDDFDLGPIESPTSSAEMHLTPGTDLYYVLEDDFMTMNEEEEQEIPSVIDDEEELFTIIEEADAIEEQEEETKEETKEQEEEHEYDERVYSDYYDFYYSNNADHTVFTSLQVNGPLMTSVDDELILFTILEEPELEEKCISEVALPTPRHASRRIRPSSSYPIEDTKTESEDYIADLDSLILNLEASLKQSEYSYEKKHATSPHSSLSTNFGCKTREKSPDAVSTRSHDTQNHDRLHIGLSILNLDESLSMR